MKTLRKKVMNNNLDCLKIQNPLPNVKKGEIPPLIKKLRRQVILEKFFGKNSYFLNPTYLGQF